MELALVVEPGCDLQIDQIASRLPEATLLIQRPYTSLEVIVEEVRRWIANDPTSRAVVSFSRSGNSFQIAANKCAEGVMAASLRDQSGVEEIIDFNRTRQEYINWLDIPSAAKPQQAADWITQYLSATGGDLEHA